jgi:hypothetical protein
MSGMVGFWYSAYDTTFPKPIPNPEPWDGQYQFSLKLKKIENSGDVTIRRYRGSSRCRICDISNGSWEFQCDGWVWPEGFLHYVDEHNVKPSEEFICYVMEK